MNIASNTKTARKSKQGCWVSFMQIYRLLYPKDPKYILSDEIKSGTPGTYGRVYKATFNGNLVAVKVLSNPNNSIEARINMRQFLKVCEVMMKQKHDRIVDFIDLDQDSSAIIMELMPLGSLQTMLHLEPDFKWISRFQIMQDVIEGMAFLHSKQYPDGRAKLDIFHQNLKSSNVLLKQIDGQLRAKIGDFGLAQISSFSEKDGSYVLLANKISKIYCAPELLGDDQKMLKFTKKCDVYSAGIIFLELITKQNPQDLRAVWQQLVDEGLPHSVDAILKKSLDQDPAARCTFTDLFKLLKDGQKEITAFCASSRKV